MYFNTDFFMRKANNDERVIGKINLRQGVAALILVLGILGVVLALSYEHFILAVLVGMLAAIGLIMIRMDPMGILRKKTRNENQMMNGHNEKEE